MPISLAAGALCRYNDLWYLLRNEEGLLCDFGGKSVEPTQRATAYRHLLAKGGLTSENVIQTIAEVVNPKNNYLLLILRVNQPPVARLQCTSVVAHENIYTYYEEQKHQPHHHGEFKTRLRFFKGLQMKINEIQPGGCAPVENGAGFDFIL